MSSYIGETGFRTVGESEGHETSAFDTLRVTRRGKYDNLASEKALWSKGASASAFGYPYMSLQSKRVDSGGSNFAVIELYFEGFLTTQTGRGYIDRTDDIALQAGSFPVSGDDSTTVQAKYYAQTTTTRWIHHGTYAPTSPRYPVTLASTVDTSILFDHYPARYSGTLQAKYVGRLMQFQRAEVAPSVWGVVETWANRIEASE